MERDAQHPAGPIGQTVQWRCRWTDAHSENPRLAAITVEDYEEAQRHRGPLFVDRSADIFRGEPVWSAQLAVGQTEWLRRLDAGLTLQQYGHHGLAIGDINGDGLEDLYVCQPAGLPNRLLLHQPDGTVRDVAAKSGVDWMEASMSTILADFDNGGDNQLAMAGYEDKLF